MSDIKVIITGDATGLEAATKKAQVELGRTAIAAQKTDSSLAKMNSGVSVLGNVTKNAASQVGMLAGSLASGGLITAITLAGVALFNLGRKMFEVGEEQKRFNDILDGAKSAYVKAVLEVDKMRDAFQKAKDGIIKKETALKLYNGTIGKTIGQTDDLKTAEDNLIANAEKYVQYTLYKTAANIALSKSAEAAFEAEAERIKGTKNVTASQKAGTLKLNIAALSSLDFKNAFITKSDEQIVSDKMQKFINIQKQFKEIYDSLIAKTKEFGFTELDQIDIINKKTAAQKQYTEALEETRSELRPFFEQEAPLSLGTGAALTPELVLKPHIKLEISPDQQKKVLDGIQSLFNAEKIQQIMDNTINSAVSGLADSFAGILSGAKNGFSGLFDGLANTLAGGLKEIGKYLVETYLLIGTIQKIKFSNPAVGVAVGFALQVLGSLIQSKINTTKAFATGVRNFEGGVALVGERGPEFVNLPRGAGVVPNNEVNAYGNGGVVLQPSIFYEGTGFRIMLNRVDASMRRNG